MTKQRINGVVVYIKKPKTYKTISNYSDAKSYFNQQSDDWTAKVSSDEMDKVYQYTDGYYHDINDPLRAGNASDEILQKEKKINAAISKFELKENLTVWRGCSKQCLPKFAYSDPTKLIGKEYFDKGFMSCGATQDSAWDSGVLFKIDVPKGTGHGAYVDFVSAHKGENEFILPSNSHFTVSDVTKSGNNWVIHMGLITDPKKYKIK